MAPIGGGIFLRGTRRDVQITTLISDEDVPLSVRQALIGVVVPTIFDGKDLGLLPRESRVAYGSEVVEALGRHDGKKQEAAELMSLGSADGTEGAYWFIAFKPREFVFVD